MIVLLLLISPPVSLTLNGGIRDVGRPSRWSSGTRDDSWRGGFLLSALEMYLKNDMRSKFHFLNDLEVAVGFTSTMMTQTYSGSTTIVPQVCLKDYFLVCDIFELCYPNCVTVSSLFHTSTALHRSINRRYEEVFSRRICCCLPTCSNA